MAIDRTPNKVTRRPIVLSDTESDGDDHLYPSSLVQPLSSSTAHNKMEFYDAHPPPAPKPKVKPREAVPVTDSRVAPPTKFGAKTASGSSGLSGNSFASSSGPDAYDRPFGSSIVGSKKSAKSAGSYGGYIKPATPNAFSKSSGSSRPSAQSQSPFHGSQSHTNASRFSAQSQFQSGGPTHNGGWPTWVTQKQPFPGVRPTAHPFPVPPVVNKDREEDDGIERERFNLDVNLTAEDYERHHGDAEAHMRELLSGAVGEGEAEDGSFEDGDDVVEGFVKGVRLMPHQVRGVKWMRSRETGRKYGGILADDMGLGKTVQTLARIVEGVATPAEIKAGYKGGTLIVAPLAVMEQWASEARTKTTSGRLKVTTHHGPSRTKSAKTLQGYDVVITTFQTLASEHKAFSEAAKEDTESEDSDSDTGVRKTLKKKAKKKNTPNCAIFGVKWLRVVIDEAQNIKNKRTNAAKAAVALQAKYRWCLTGTPIQNNVEELYSLFKFLRAKPMDDWDVFNHRISLPVRQGQTKVAMKRLHVLLKAVMLRRTKDATLDGKPILNLPGRTVDIVACEFDKEEREFYTALEQQTALTFNKFVKAGTVMSNYTSVLTMLLRLRQACDHPSLVASALSVDADALENKKAQAPDDSDSADELADLLGGLGVDKSKKCEICFTTLSAVEDGKCTECVDIAKKAAAKGADEEHLPDYSAKIRMLLKIIKQVEERSGKKEKTIVFSQFTSFLNLIEPFLRQEGISFVRYDGAMRNDKRQESLEKIKTDPTIRLILISFKAGSTGLNLTCCNNVVLMDMWWNPALEDQAFDRAHRLGQKLDVNIYKLTIGETVEDRILKLQEQKRELAKAALSGDAKNLTKLTLNDIMALFKAGATHHDSDDER
ncbi:SNF2 family N-terminal domain-containing protein [Papiliotrema laurentii]|uniref:SNF2 family N-terminal domain-containing protein n=1 Tax=Papiliotrema laurentii TaxID=5418 RepID=A0AAD9L6K6_PAPLA|nr:SNF2 family N-terminal domain-containing protein [Papiliotrema laurentii]